MPHVSELHAQHDPLIVASLAAGDLAGADRDHASAQIASCADCAVLHADLIAIARATASLPPAVAPRDFRLSPEQAAALRPVGWRRLVAAIGGSRPLMSRQLGIGLATMGLAGLLVSTLPGIQLGAASPAGSGSRTGVTVGESGGESNGLVGVAGDASSAAPAYAGPADQAGSPTAARAAPAASGAYSDSSAAQGSAVSPGGTPETAEGGNVFGANSTSKAESDNLTSLPLLSDDGAAPSDGGRGLLVAGSLVLLVVGIALLVIRRLVRRPSWS